MVRKLEPALRIAAGHQQGYWLNAPKGEKKFFDTAGRTYWGGYNGLPRGTELEQKRTDAHNWSFHIRNTSEIARLDRELHLQATEQRLEQINDLLQKIPARSSLEIILLREKQDLLQGQLSLLSQVRNHSLERE